MTSPSSRATNAIVRLSFVGAVVLAMSAAFLQTRASADNIRTSKTSLKCVEQETFNTFNCTVKVVASAPLAPRGKVDLRAVDGSGQFISTSLPGTRSCELKPSDTLISTCEIEYRNNAVGTHEIVAEYGTNVGGIRPSSGRAPALVRFRFESFIDFTCPPDGLVPVGSSILCTAEVSHVADPELRIPTGIVRIVDTSGKGEIGGRCILARANQFGASCTIAFTGPSPGPARITAKYLGDDFNGQREAATTVRAFSIGVRFAAPDGTGADPCENPIDPCSLRRAAGSFAQVPTSSIAPGAEVVLLPGNYSESANLSIESGTQLHGQAGQPRPVIDFSNGGLFAGSFREIEPVVAHVEINSANSRIGLRVDDGTIEDVVVRTSASSATSCTGSGSFLIRDAVCFSSGAGSTAVGAFAFTERGGLIDNRIVNVTAVSTGAGSFGINYRVESEGPAPRLVADVLSVIARGTGADVAARSIGLTPGSGGQIDLRLENSDYTNTLPITNANGGPVAITPAGSGTNIVAPPLFAADGYHQVPASPTIDSGALSASSRTIDIDGQPRPGGAASDIGADEFSEEALANTTTTLECGPILLNRDNASLCLATVRDTSATPTAPVGEVEFNSDAAQGTFSNGALCVLDNFGADSASCEIAYTAGSRGAHHLTGEFTGSVVHNPSEGTRTLTVRTQAEEEEGGILSPTTTTLDCEPNPVLFPGVSVCVATVLDTSSNPTLPFGRVDFSTAAGGTFSEGGSCMLAAAGPDKASCARAYTPTKIGSGTHPLGANYRGDPLHDPSQGAESLAVLARTQSSVEPTRSARHLSTATRRTRATRRARARVAAQLGALVGHVRNRRAEARVASASSAGRG
jgi:hypothetical protein